MAPTVPNDQQEPQTDWSKILNLFLWKVNYENDFQNLLLVSQLPICASHIAQVLLFVGHFCTGTVYRR